MWIKKKFVYLQCNQKTKKMDIRETKQRVLTNKHYYVLEHNYCKQGCVKINGVEIISPALYIYIITEVKNINNAFEITMNLNIEDCNGVTIARFKNIDYNNTYDFDEELSTNLQIILGEIEKNENYYK